MLNIKLPKLAKNSAIYSIVIILEKGLSFFLLPLYTAYLTPSDYGILNIVTSTTSLLSLFFLLGLNGAATRFYYQHKDDAQYVRELWGTIATFVIINSLVLGSLFFVFHRFIIDPLIGEISFYPYFVLGLATTIITPLYSFFQSYLQTRQEGIKYGANKLTCFLIQVGLIILFVVGFKMDVVGVLLANLITAFIFFIYTFIVFVPKIKLGINKSIIIPAFKYSLPLVPHLLAGWSSGLLDRLLINGMKNEYETGLYSVGNQFGSITSSLTNAVNLAYVPWFMEAYEAKRFSSITKTGFLVVLLYCVVAFGVSLFCPEILKIMVSEQFQVVWNIIPMLSFACVLNGVYFLFVNTLFLEKTKYVFIISVTAIVFNIILNLLLIPKFSYVGSAIACMITYIIKSIVSMVLSKHFVKEVNFRPLLLYIMVFSFFALTFINYFTNNLLMWQSLLIKTMVCGILFSVFWLKYKSQVLNLVSELRNRK